MSFYAYLRAGDARYQERFGLDFEEFAVGQRFKHRPGVTLSQQDNADEALKPGMNAWLQLNTASEPMLLIPSQALIDTGSEQRVITVDADGRFVPKRVAVFQASQGVTALRSGLAEGEKVVSSGLFLIDSEANISGALERMRSESATHAH